MSKIINWYPDAPNTDLWRNHDLNVKREFYPSVSIRFEELQNWHECEQPYKEGYELLWSLRQEEHTAEEREALEAQYAAWQASSWTAAHPALAAEIDASVPVKQEQEEGGEV